MKVLDVDELHAGLTRNINRMNRLEKEITAIQKAVEELTAMEDALKGEGGQSIRDFYTSCHLPFLQYFLTFKEEFTVVLQQAQQALSSLEPMDDGHIVEEFLETKVEEGLTASADITTALTDEANAIMDEVADIVGLPKLDDTLVHESIADAKTKRDDTVEALHTFDSTQTAQLIPIETSIQSMKEWVKNIEGLFQAGLTDVDFPADTWSAMASRSSLGMEIAAQQAPVGSVAYALHEQNQLAIILRASLSNMAPIRFGFGGFAQKSYPTYGPVMLGLGNLSRGNQTSETVQQVSKRSDPDLEEIYAALAKQTEGMDVGSPSSPGTYSVKEELTYEGMRKVLGGNGSGTPDGLAPYAMAAYNFFVEDIKTILDPEATAVEKSMAIGFTFFKPAKLMDKAGDVAGAARDAGKAVDKGTGELNKDLAKAYLRDIEDKTERKVNKEQIHLIKEALRNKNYEKLTPKETAKHRSKFTSSLKDKLIAEWEEKTNQKWPRYTEEVLDKNGEVARNIGQPYDAHHIIENNFGGPHEWWNIHPAKYPNEHQAGIHGKGAPSGKLFPRR